MPATPPPQVAVATPPPEKPLDGVDLVPFFTGRKSGDPHEELFWRWGGQAAVRQGDWKYLQGGGRSYLFNLAGAPWLSQKWVRAVKEQAFGDITPFGGYNGDEDQGQMGALALRRPPSLQSP